MTRLILLDRDGVINYDSPDYIKDADEWTPIPGALDAVARLKAAGCRVAVCTNQAGIGRGLITPDALERIHTRMAEALAAAGARLDGILHCPHRPEDGCACRKPRPGMLLEMMRRLNADAADTIYVGDRVRDVEAARAAGCRAALIRGAGADVERRARALNVDWVADDLRRWVDELLGTVPC